jgi:hypothetical protein
MQCPSCGLPIAPSALACAACGLKLAPAAAPAKSSTAIASTGDFDDEAWAEVIGPSRLDDYLDRFGRHWDDGARVGWHWPALLCTSAWLLYRKMWRQAAIYSLLIPALYFGLALTAVAFGLTGILMRIAFGIVGTALFLVLPPMFADNLYRRHCQRLIEREKAKAGERPDYLLRLRRLGGTSTVAVAVAAFGLAILGAAWAMTVAIPSYRNYAVHTRMNLALNLGMNVADQIAAIHERGGRIPVSAAELPRPPVYPDFVELIKIYQGTRVIEVLVTPSEPGQPEMNGSIYISPEIGADGKPAWACSTSASVRAFAPSRCRKK